MKKGIIVLLVSILLSSCSTTYYYSKLSTSNSHIFKMPSGDFVTENDSLYIIYSFFGEDAPINIGVYNKTDEGLYVDWSRSALMIKGVSYTDGGVNESVRNELEDVAFVAPQSQINRTMYKLANFPFNKIPNKKYAKIKFAQTYKTVDVKKAEFSEQDTPLRLSSYITVYDKDPSQEKSEPMVFDQKFYLSSVMKAKGNLPPEEVMEYISQQGDFFFIRNYKESKFGQVMAAIGIGAAYIAIEVIAASSSSY